MKPYCNISAEFADSTEANKAGVTTWQGLIDCIPGCTMVDAIWSIADKVIWVDLGKALRIRKVYALQPQGEHSGMQMHSHLQLHIAQVTSH